MVLSERVTAGGLGALCGFLETCTEWDGARPPCLASPTLQFDCSFTTRKSASHQHIRPYPWKIPDHIRSPINKPVRARLVVGWLTTSESLVLYVFSLFSLPVLPNQRVIAPRRLLLKSVKCSNCEFHCITKPHYQGSSPLF